MITPKISPSIQTSTGLIAKKRHLDQHDKSASNHLSAMEKTIIALGAIFYSAGNMQETLEHKNVFSANGIPMQFFNSILPFLISNLGGCLFMLYHTDSSRTLLQEYQQARNEASKDILFHQYQLLLKIGFRITLHSNPEIMEKLEPEFINLITQLYFSGKTPAQLNQTLDEALACLQNNSDMNQRYLFRAACVLLALGAITIASFGTYFIKPKSAYAISGLFAACIIALAMIRSHTLEHTTYFTFSIKKDVKKALTKVGVIEADAQRMINALFTQVSEEEKRHLKEQVEQLSPDEVRILLDNPSTQQYTPSQMPLSTSPETTWSFFKNMGLQTGDIALAKAGQARQSSFEMLINSFSRLQPIIQEKKSVILRLFPGYLDNLSLVVHPNIDIKTQANSICEALKSLKDLINSAVIATSPDFRNAIEGIDEFVKNYLHFQKNKNRYNLALDHINSLQLSRLGPYHNVSTNVV